MRYFKLVLLLILLSVVVFVGCKKKVITVDNSTIEQNVERDETVIEPSVIVATESKKSNDNISIEIFKASKNGNLVDIKKLVNKDIDINALDENGETVLTLASSNGHLEIVKYLIENGADINFQYNSGGGDLNQSALMSASMGGYLDIVKYLVDNGADIDARDYSYSTAVFFAGVMNKPEIVYYLVSVGAEAYLEIWASIGDLEKVKSSVKNGEDINQQDDYGMSPFLRAVSNGHLEVVEYLIKNGADDENMSNGIIEASQYGRLDVLKYLIENGADATAKMSDGETYLEYAISRSDKYPEVIKYLESLNVSSVSNNKNVQVAQIDKTIKCGDIYLSAKNGDLKCVQQNILNGVDVNIKTENSDMMGNTPLMTASFYGHLEIVKYLIDEGADVNASRRYGNITALNEASQNGHDEIVQLLIKHGAIDSSLIDASQSGDIDKVSRLIKQGSDVNLQAYSDTTALIKASSNGHLEIVKLLIKSGSKVNTQDMYGQTALMLSSFDGHLDIVKYLVDNGADIDLKSGMSDGSLSGEPAISYAKDSGYIEIVEYLERLK